MKRFRLTTPANRDVLEILSYLAEKSPAASQRLAENLFREFRHLAEWPEAGRLRPEFTRAPLRFWPLKPYFVIYHATLEPLTVVRVLHTARDLPSILEDTPFEETEL